MTPRADPARTVGFGVPYVDTALVAALFGTLGLALNRHGKGQSAGERS